MKINKLIALGSLTALTLSVAALPAGAQNTNTNTAPKSERHGMWNRHANDQALSNVQKADDVIGKEVTSSDGQKLGKIKDLAVDLESGRILFATVKDRAVPPQSFSDASGGATLSIDRSKFDSAPQVKNDDQLRDAAFINSVYQYYGQQSAWNGATPQNAFANVYKFSDLKGMNVDNTADKKIGDIKNAAVNLQAGRVVYLILDSNLISGNEKYVAVPPMTFTPSADKKKLVADIDQTKLESAPHFSKDNWPDLSDNSFTSQVYQHFGKTAPSDLNGGMTPTGRDYQHKNQNKQND